MSLSTTNQFELNSDPVLSNAAVNRIPSESSSFRDPIPSTSTANPALPPLPPRIDNMSLQPSYGMGGGYGYGSMGGMAGSYGLGGFGGYGAGYGSYGMGGGYGMGGMGGMYGGYNRFGAGGPMYGDIENRFIQMAEESSRPAFDSIQSVVHAVGSVAMMLENTFFALSSSFRAILGVAENFGRLRSLFAQFWSTFAVIRTLNWLIRKLLVNLGIRTESEFKAWAEAVAATQSAAGGQEQPRSSSWPILLFFGVITAAPYIVLRMMRGLSTTLHERLNDPKTWQNPLKAIGQHAFQATSPQEISFAANQVIHLAPQSLQGNLWNSGWLMGSTDRQTAGLVPVNYIKVVRPAAQAPQVKPDEPNMEDLDKFYGDEL